MLFLSEASLDVQPFIIKVFRPVRDCFRRELVALNFVTGKLPLPTPEVVGMGEIEGWPYLVTTQMRGRIALEVWPHLDTRQKRAIVRELGAALRELHQHAAPLSDAALNRDWDGFLARQMREAVARQAQRDPNPEWLESLPDFLAERRKLLPDAPAPQVFLHGDVHNGNLMLQETSGGAWRIAGLFDFGDSLCGNYEYDLLAPGLLMLPGQGKLQREFFAAYGYATEEMDDDLRGRLMVLTICYECSNLRKYAERLAPSAVRLTLAQLEAAIWSF